MFRSCRKIFISAPKITSKISLVNWDQMSAKQVYNLHRALLGLYPLTTSYQNTKVKLLDVRAIKAEGIAANLKEEVPGKRAVLLYLL